MLVFRVCGAGQNFYVFSLYRNPDLDEPIFDGFLTSMAAVQAEDVSASFLFAGDLNGHHQEWLGSTITNRHEVPASLWCFSCAVGTGAGYTRRCDRTSVHLSASSLQNLAVSQDFYSLVSISVERSW